jgi:hypothetical protein
LKIKEILRGMETSFCRAWKRGAQNPRRPFPADLRVHRLAYPVATGKNAGDDAA